MKSFLKWAGGKYRIIDKILKVLPEGNRLIEPFAGSAVVSLNANYEKLLISDINKDLINIYLLLQSSSEHFIGHSKNFFNAENNTAEQYYFLRNEFNESKDIQKRAAIFIYLNRHCFNGLCRYNSKGIFNVPFGKYKNPKFPEKELYNFATKTKGAKFIHQDFRITMQSAQIGDVVYCDPPYVPLSATSSFTSYSENGFNLQDQQDLADLSSELSKKGIPVVISNHDTDFTRIAYAKAELLFFDVQRFISSDSQNRNKANELLAVYA